VLRIGLSDGVRSELGKIERDAAISGPVFVGAESLYIPATQGVFVVKLDGHGTRLVKRGDELPDAEVHALVEAGGSLYVGCSRMMLVGRAQDGNFEPEEGLLIRCDLDFGNVEVLASSARRESLTCLDNCDPFRVTGFYEDRPRKRLISGTGGEPKSRSAGLYEFSLQDSGIKRLGLPGSFMHIAGPRAWTNDSCLVGSAFGHVCIWDCSTDKPVNFISGQKWFGQEPQLKQDDPSVETIAQVGEWVYSGAHVGQPGAYYGMAMLRAKKGETIDRSRPLPPLHDNEPVILGTWKGKLVAVSDRAAWLLEPKEDASSASRVHEETRAQ
jgi:hypothetical protein